MLYNCVTTVLSEANYPPPKTLFDEISDIHIVTNSFKQNEEFKMTPPNVVLLLEKEANIPMLLVHKDVLEKVSTQTFLRIEVDSDEFLDSYWGCEPDLEGYDDYRCITLDEKSTVKLIAQVRRLSAIVKILLEESETEDIPTVLFEG